MGQSNNKIEGKKSKNLLDAILGILIGLTPLGLLYLFMHMILNHEKFSIFIYFFSFIGYVTFAYFCYLYLFKREKLDKWIKKG